MGDWQVVFFEIESGKCLFIRSTTEIHEKDSRPAIGWLATKNILHSPDPCFFVGHFGGVTTGR